MFLLLSIFVNGSSQNFQKTQSERVKENFDESWQFHKVDIAIKLSVKAGRQGGLTDANVKRIEGEEAIIAYTDKNKVAPEHAPTGKTVRCLCQDVKWQESRKLIEIS